MTTLDYSKQTAVLSRVQVEVNQTKQYWSYIDYKNVLVHELGHVLGLEHSERFDSVMHPMGQLGDYERELTAEDKSKFCELKPVAQEVQVPESQTGCSQAGFFPDMSLFGLLLIVLLSRQLNLLHCAQTLIDMFVYLKLRRESMPDHSL